MKISTSDLRLGLTEVKKKNGRPHIYKKFGRKLPVTMKTFILDTTEKRRRRRRTKKIPCSVSPEKSWKQEGELVRLCAIFEGHNALKCADSSVAGEKHEKKRKITKLENPVDWKSKL